MTGSQDMNFNLGPCPFPSPLKKAQEFFVTDDDQVLLASTLRELGAAGSDAPTFEMAGPREKIFFDPRKTRGGIVTCGGLCPGINDVIRSLVMTLSYAYGVPKILGFRYGYRGLSSAGKGSALELTPEKVKNIHEDGGTLLGSSRGPQDVWEMVDTLVEFGVNLLFAVGGDGTLKGASAIAEEIARRGLEIAVIGIPKTIDNDLEWVTQSFGFNTAVEEARKAITAAHAEAIGALNGIGLVKLMGRHAGSIAAQAVLASGDANFCLVPEVPFRLEGKGGFLQALEERLRHKRHAVIVVAEGAGQDLMEKSGERQRDASGNVRLKDIGDFLQEHIVRFLKERKLEMTLKYIDPSYIIRSLPANAFDSGFCLVLGQQAVHAAMAGKTQIMIGHWNRHFTHVPLEMATKRRRQLDEKTWQRVLEATGQPTSFFTD